MRDRESARESQGEKKKETDRYRKKEIDRENGREKERQSNIKLHIRLDCSNLGFERDQQFR